MLISGNCYNNYMMFFIVDSFVVFGNFTAALFIISKWMVNSFSFKFSNVAIYVFIIIKH